MLNEVAHFLSIVMDREIKTHVVIMLMKITYESCKNGGELDPERKMKIIDQIRMVGKKDA